MQRISICILTRFCIVSVALHPILTHLTCFWIHHMKHRFGEMYALGRMLWGEIVCVSDHFGCCPTLVAPASMCKAVWELMASECPPEWRRFPLTPSLLCAWAWYFEEALFLSLCVFSILWFPQTGNPLPCKQIVLNARLAVCKIARLEYGSANCVMNRWELFQVDFRRKATSLSCC